MSLITEERLINRLDQEIRKGGYGYYDTIESKARTFINESRTQQRTFSSKKYDIFLSHSSDDAKKVAGMKLLLEDLGFSVYVDWIEDPELDRSQVSKKNAQILRSRMKSCGSLLYAFSKNASTSTWMPWELGYFDGIKGLVAVVPISKSATYSFTGNEYLGLYPYVDINTMQQRSNEFIWVNESTDTYVEFRQWLDGVKPYKRKESA